MNSFSYLEPVFCSMYSSNCCILTCISVFQEAVQAVWYSHLFRNFPQFFATLFIIARTWKQPRCPSADECIRKQWYIYTMEYYSAIKKNAFESVLMRWMRLEPIIQSEVSQNEKQPIQYTNAYKWNLERW